ncbi:MAG: DUF4270 family protein [Muribaculaceae bacterium]|nr:DUF4270 family protein [Muribaculaceae bacterium]
MRKFLFVSIIAAVWTVCFNSCTDDTIGTSISDIQSAIIQDSSFVMTGKTVRNSHLRSRSSIQLLGNINAQGYGTLSSDVVAQFMPTTTIDTVGVHGGDQWIDSCFITMRVAMGDFTGDSLTPMRLSVYELNQPLPSPIYTDFNPSGYYNTGDLMGSVTYSANQMVRDTLVTTTGATSIYYEINVPVSVDYARAIFNQYKINPATFETPAEFAEFFPGIYITNSYGQGRVMNFYDIEFVTYYRKYEKRADDTDTIYPGTKQSYMAVTPEVLYNNNIDLEPDDAVRAMVEAGDAIVMGPAGYEVEVDFPIQDIINNFKAGSKDGLGVVNNLAMELPVEKVPNKYDIAPPKYLLMVKKSYRDEFFDKDTLTNDKDAFYAEYDASTSSYIFGGMRDYLLDVMKKNGGDVSEKDVEFVIMPIDVTKFTNTTSYSYYYSSSSTSQVVTKIAPAISRPSIAKLRLDKAKVKLVYSRQSVY